MIQFMDLVMVAVRQSYDSMSYAKERWEHAKEKGLSQDKLDGYKELYLALKSRHQRIMKYKDKRIIRAMPKTGDYALITNGPTRG